MSRPWMPIYWGDYLADTQHLSLEEHGAYLLLIAHYWSRGSLPADDASLKRILGLHGRMGENRWRSICLAIAPFFDENWCHKRIDAEISRAENIKIKRQLAGTKGGRLSRGRKNSARMDTGSVKANAQQTGGIHSSVPLTQSTEPRAPAREAEAPPPQDGGRSTGLAPTEELIRAVQRKRWA